MNETRRVPANSTAGRQDVRDLAANSQAADRKHTMSPGEGMGKPQGTWDTTLYK